MLSKITSIEPNALFLVTVVVKSYFSQVLAQIVQTCSWNVVFVLGILIGGYFAGTYFPSDIPVDISDATSDKLAALGITDFSGLHPSQIFAMENLGSPTTLISVILGGFLVGFGTRYAGGCTSGHAIMGLSLLNVGSLVAVIGFFVGGLLMSWFVLPSILSLI